MASVTAEKQLDDLVLLDSPDSQRVAAALTTRFKSGSIYTSIGEVLLSINPYRSLLLPGSSKGYYEDTVIDSYVGRNRGDLPPHIFRIAEDAHSTLVRLQQSVSVIVSGESGAGKTEACRQLLNYLTRASNGIAKSKVSTINSSGSPAQLVRDRLITSSTLLEAFGNAATVRNDNSSRYGKLMRISFTPSGVARGGSCKVYLLEKHRVVSILEDLSGDAPLERTFHVLHQLASGATPEMRKDLHIATSYRILGGSSRTARTITGVNDARNFSGLMACFKILSVSSSVQKEIFRTLSIVLNLGELDFIDAPSASHSDSALIDDEPGSSSSTSFAALVSLIGCDKKTIETALTQRTIKIRTERTQVMLNKKLATASRNALAKTLYERLFLHIVDLINKSCDVLSSVSASTAVLEIPSTTNEDPSSTPSQPSSPSSSAETPLVAPLCDYNTISLLDIYGFESFDKPLENRFDQLLVNFCNERLQDLFIRSTLVAEQQVYESEGIPWTPIVVFDTKSTIDLISGKKGIFPVLDDATRLPTSTLLAADSASARSNHNDDNGDVDAEEAVEAADEREKEAIAAALLEKLNRAIHSNSLFRTSKHRGGGFIVTHFAGEVRYSCDDLLEANRDAARIDHDNLFLLNAATSPFLKSLFDSSNSNISQKSAIRKQMKMNNSKQKGSVSHDFSTSINELIDTLTASSLCYVRTIKPNATKTPMGVDDDVLESQIKYLGLVENIAVRRAGYALRLPFEDFFSRYRQLSSSTWPPSKTGDAADVTNEVRKLINALNLRPRPTAVLQLNVKNNKSNAALKPGVAKLVTAPPPRALPIIAVSASHSSALPPSSNTASIVVGVNTSAVLPLSTALPSGFSAIPSSASSSSALTATTTPLAPLLSGLVGDTIVPGSYKLTEGIDVVFGSSMLFVREAKHLFDLEHLRQLGLGYQQTVVARLWRSHAQRRNYIRILSSFKVLITRVKGRCLRNKFIMMKKASINLQAIIRGHLMRRRHSDIREAVGLVRYLGKQRRSLSIRWLQPQHGDWLGILSPPPLPFFTPIFGMKAAHALLNVVKKRGTSPSASTTTIASLPELIFYVDNVVKVKPATSWAMKRRTIIVCSGLLICFKFPLIHGKISRVILLSDISSASLSPYCDSFVTLHMAKQSKSFSAYAESKVSLLKSLPSTIPVNISTNWAVRGRNGEKAPLFSIVFAEVLPSVPSSLPSHDLAAAASHFNSLFTSLLALPGGAGAGGGKVENVALTVAAAISEVGVTSLAAAAAAATTATTTSTNNTTAIPTPSTSPSPPLPTVAQSLPPSSLSELGFFHTVDPMNPKRLTVTVSASRKKTLVDLLTDAEKTGLRARKLWIPKA
jgi:hypothetical protein